MSPSTLGAGRFRRVFGSCLWTLFLLRLAGLTMMTAAEREALPAVDDKWRYYQSPNFELYSRNDDATSRELLHNLELLRALFLERFKFVERARLDVTVYLFRSQQDFKAYARESMAKSDFFKGFYYPWPDRAVISLAPVDDPESAQRMIFHEYVHHLFRAAEQDPPVWYNEGMAELIAGMRVIGGGDTVEIGRPPLGRLARLQNEKFLPLETLFAVDHSSPIYRSGSDHTGVFYAESWALVHYLYHGKSKIPPEAVHRFLAVAGNRKAVQSVNLPDFFRECFGMDYATMQRRLEDYVREGSYGYGSQPVPKIAAEKTYTMRPLSRDEIRVRLADLALRVNRSAAGKLVLVDAAEKPGADPRIFETLGSDAIFERDTATTQQRWEQAIAAGTHNTAIYRELALLESRQWFQQYTSSFRLPEETTVRLRERLLRSIEYEPRQTAAYEMLAWVEGYSEQPAIANVNLVQQHFSELRQKARTLLALALVRVHVGKPDDAKAMLEKVASLEPDAWTANVTESVLAKIEGRKPKITRPRGPMPPPPPPGSGLKTPAVEIPGAR